MSGIADRLITYVSGAGNVQDQTSRHDSARLNAMPSPNGRHLRDQLNIERVWLEDWISLCRAKFSLRSINGGSNGAVYFGSQQRPL